MTPFFPWIGAMAGAVLLAADPSPARLHELDARAQAATSRRFVNDKQIRQWEETVAELVHDYPKDPISLYWSGVMLDRSNKPAEASARWKECIERIGNANDSRLSSLLADASTLLGTIELATGHGQKAFDFARKALEANPEKVEAYRLLTDAGFQLARLDDVKAIIAARTEPLENASSEVLMARLTLLADRGEWDEIASIVDRRRRSRPLCPAALLFAARIADRQRKTPQASALFVLASLNGPNQGESTMRADDWISRRAYERLARPEDAPHDLIWVHDLTMRLEVGTRRGLPLDLTELQGTISAAKELPTSTREEKLARNHLLATLQLFARQWDEAEKTWMSMTLDHPDFVPAWCRRAEFEEASDDPAIRAKAKSSWTRGFDLEPKHPLVRDWTRLGVDVEVVERGVRLARVERYSPAEEIGWGVDDIITQVGSLPLDRLTTMERIRRVRLFGGGEIHWIDPAGRTHQVDVSYLLLD
jgi:tetratricopeptide (TPR) repeat protein